MDQIKSKKCMNIVGKMANPYSEGRLMVGNINVIRENLGDIISKLIVLIGYDNINAKEIPCELTKKLSDIVCNIDDINKLNLGELKPILEIVIQKSQDILQYINTIGIEEARLNAGLSQKGGRRGRKGIEKFLRSVINLEKRLNRFEKS